MLEARSVAVVGASVKPRLARSPDAGGAATWRVRRARSIRSTPATRRSTGLAVLRRRSATCPSPVDLAILGVANHRIEAGAAAMPSPPESGAAVTFSSLYEESRRTRRAAADRAGRPRSRVAAGMALCGGNGMGFLQPGAPAAGDRVRDARRRAGRTGDVHLALRIGVRRMAFNDRGIGFNLLVSSGQEIVTTMADYMEYALGRADHAGAGAAARDRPRPCEVLRAAGAGRPGGRARCWR